MPITTPELQIRTPAGKIPFGRGFYQLEEESLYLPIEYVNLQKRFYSYLDSETVSLHIDRAGRLIFIEVNIPRRRWRVKEHFIPPEIAGPAEARFLDFRKTMAEPKVFCDNNRTNLLILFDNQPATAIWASDISDDLAGREIALWRRSLRKTATVSHIA